MLHHPLIDQKQGLYVILAWAAVFFIFVAPYPTTVWLLRHSPLPTSKGLALILAAGLGIGLLTWIMMAEGMLGIRFELWSILLPYIIALLPGTFFWWRNRNLNSLLESPSAMKWRGGQGGEDFDLSSGELHTKKEIESEVQRPAPKRLRIIGRLVIIVVSAAVLLNAIYWPFYKADALGIYADQAHFMYATRGPIRCWCSCRTPTAT